MAGEGNPTMYYYIKECVLKEECNEHNFKSWRVYGETPEAAKEQLMKHLCRCGLHQKHRGGIGDDDIRDFYQNLIDMVEVDVWDESEQQQPSERSHKRRRKAGQVHASIGISPYLDFASLGP